MPTWNDMCQHVNAIIHIHYWHSKLRIRSVLASKNSSNRSLRCHGLKDRLCECSVFAQVTGRNEEPVIAETRLLRVLRFMWVTFRGDLRMKTLDEKSCSAENPNYQDSMVTDKVLFDSEQGNEIQFGLSHVVGYLYQAAESNPSAVPCPPHHSPFPKRTDIVSTLFCTSHHRCSLTFISICSKISVRIWISNFGLKVRSFCNGIPARTTTIFVLWLRLSILAKYRRWLHDQVLKENTEIEQ